MFKLSWLVMHRAFVCAVHTPCLFGATHREAAVRKTLSTIQYQFEPFLSSGSGAIVATVETLDKAINMTLEKRHLDENLKMAHVDTKMKNFEIMMLEQHSQVQAAAAATPVPSGGDTVIDEAKVTELTKCMLDFKGMVKPMHFSGSSDEWKEFRDDSST